MKYTKIKKQDLEVFEIIKGEEKRQKKNIELIASENYVSDAVREALASEFTNKYAEGRPGKRFYGGQEWTDKIEILAQERAKKLFKCQYVNVQPLSGAPANLAVYTALLKPGDKILGMDLGAGGHLTHGHPATHSGKIYNFIAYGLNPESEEIDYEEVEKLALKHKPKIILAGFSAYPRNINWEKFRKIADKIDAILMADIAHIAGLIAGKVVENPFDYGFDIVTTTTHKTLRGPRGGMIMVRDNLEIFKKINSAVFPGLQGGPHMNNITALAVALGEAQKSDFKRYTKQILKNTQAMVKVFEKNNVKMISGGSDNHLILIDVWKSFGIGGKEAQERLEKAGITVNKNMIFQDKRNANDPSGIRLGTPAMTTKGYKTKEFKEVAQKIINILKK